ncbi:MAG: epoxyqueuosine reductase [bacterium]
MDVNRADRILVQAKTAGATLAGLVGVEALDGAPAFRDHPLKWPASARSVLVLALSHPESEPELDWWGGQGGTPGNRVLIRISQQLKPWLNDELEAHARVLPYHVEKGGIFLKDAAVLAGLGALGANNLLITPELGPRVRLKALLLGVDAPDPPDKDFDPCDGCERPCLSACPQQAFSQGTYDIGRCSIQMRQDEERRASDDQAAAQDLPARFTRYCRACELACPVGRASETGWISQRKQEHDGP